MSYIRDPIYIYWSGEGIFCYDDTESLHGYHDFIPTTEVEDADLVAYKHMIAHVVAFYKKGRVEDAVTVFLAIAEDIEWRAAGGMVKVIEDILEKEMEEK